VVRGTITAISGTSVPATVTITPTNGTAVTVNVTASTKITRNRQTATLADLQKNDKASATYDSGNNALRLEAHTPVSVVRGTITAVSGTAVPATVTITPQNGAAVTVNITASTKITRNGKTATLADLQQNDKARAVYDSSNNALTLVARGS
jgi:GTPase involved in cell partitioning and DNA repair